MKKRMYTVVSTALTLAMLFAGCSNKKNTDGTTESSNSAGTKTETEESSKDKDKAADITAPVINMAKTEYIQFHLEKTLISLMELLQQMIQMEI